MQGDLQCPILLDISNKNDNNADEKMKTLAEFVELCSKS